ncbi:hypothetical protein [Algivirga pacifica]|uniref:Uncharacterized protein n=1 Tax=Algivirga pacifica TaxID=1162670 RepID=A0ABP9D6W9_9BACT
MAIFLTPSQHIKWLERLIRESEEELVMVVHDLKALRDCMSILQEIDQQGVEQTIIYQQSGILSEELKDFWELKHLTLLKHASLQEYSYFNNKLLLRGVLDSEGSVLYHSTDLEGTLADYITTFTDFTESFQNALEQASLIKRSTRLHHAIPYQDGEEQAMVYCEALLPHFPNKLFYPLFSEEGEWVAQCEGYAEGIDILLEKERLGVTFQGTEEKRQALYRYWMIDNDPLEFRGFKQYWQHPNAPLYLYRNYEFDWDSLIASGMFYKKIQQGADWIVEKVDKIIPYLS